jgi:hypothetical protein
MKIPWSRSECRRPVTPRGPRIRYWYLDGSASKATISATTLATTHVPRHSCTLRPYEVVSHASRWSLRNSPPEIIEKNRGTWRKVGVATLRRCAVSIATTLCKPLDTYNILRTRCRPGSTKQAGVYGPLPSVVQNRGSRKLGACRMSRQ